MVACTVGLLPIVPTYLPTYCISIPTYLPTYLCTYKHFFVQIFRLHSRTFSSSTTHFLDLCFLNNPITKHTSRDLSAFLFYETIELHIIFPFLTKHLVLQNVSYCRSPRPLPGLRPPGPILQQFRAPVHGPARPRHGNRRLAWRSKQSGRDHVSRFFQLGRFGPNLRPRRPRSSLL